MDLLIKLYTDRFPCIPSYIFHLEQSSPIFLNFLLLSSMPPSMGSILPDWLIDVHIMFMLLPVTLHMAQFFLDSSLQKEGKKFDLLSEEQRNIADQECNKINEVSTTFYIKESSFIIQFTMKKLFIKDFPQRHLQGAPRNHKQVHLRPGPFQDTEQ